VRELLAVGANPRARGRGARTAQAVAVEGGNEEVVVALAESGRASTRTSSREPTRVVAATAGRRRR
jgi:hypothetical protein